MKVLGLILFSIGIALLIFLIYSFLKEKSGLVSPVPEDKGIKVIFATPTK